MVDEIMLGNLGESLRGEAYFISPQYKCTEISHRHKFGGSTKTRYDDADLFLEWLHSNSIYFGHSDGDEARNGGYSSRCLFAGLNGSICEIKFISVDEDRVIAGFTKEREWEVLEEKNYFRFVRVRYMPKTKGIPEELSSKLIAYGYKVIEDDLDAGILKDAKELIEGYI